MNYQKQERVWYTLEKVGYAWTATGVGAVLYGIVERDVDAVRLGVGNIFGGIWSVVMARTVRECVRDVQSSSPSLEVKLEPE